MSEGDTLLKQRSIFRLLVCLVFLGFLLLRLAWRGFKLSRRGRRCRRDVLLLLTVDGSVLFFVRNPRHVEALESSSTQPRTTQHVLIQIPGEVKTRQIRWIRSSSSNKQATAKCLLVPFFHLVTCLPLRQQRVYEKEFFP